MCANAGTQTLHTCTEILLANPASVTCSAWDDVVPHSLKKTDANDEHDDVVLRIIIIIIIIMDGGCGEADGSVCRCGKFWMATDVFWNFEKSCVCAHTKYTHVDNARRNSQTDWTTRTKDARASLLPLHEIVRRRRIRIATTRNDEQ